jgi:repressor LexA
LPAQAAILHDPGSGITVDELTRRQAQVLELIRRHLADRGVPPTRVEISQRLGFRSANAAEAHLRALARKGYIRLVPGISRGIQLPARRRGHEGLPIVGRVAAGLPILAEQNIEGNVSVGRDVFRPRADYLLRVRGMSMRDAGILDGDLLAVHRTQDVQNGQIVVARVNDEVTVKRFHKQGRHVRLTAAHPEFATLLVDLRGQVLAIEGVAVGVIRNGKIA